MFFVCICVFDYSSFFHQEPELPNVHDEDKVIVRNVLYAAKVCISESEGIDNWAVTVHDRGYIVNVYLAEHMDVSLPLRDLMTIQEVNPLRVLNVSVLRPVKNPASIRVFVSNKDQPISLTETDVVRIRKRARFADIFLH